MGFLSPLHEVDPVIAKLINDEAARQESGLEMIPSENFAPAAILEANASVLTNKYAEGLPSKRYYGGCQVVDQVEEIAIERAKKLFGVEFANVQPHSGAQANQAVFEALLSHGDTLMGMRLDHGGHLTHGSPVNFSGKNYKIVAYGVQESTGLIDSDQVRELALEHRPKMIICGASAYSRKIDFAMFRKVADEVGAYLMADIAHYAGLIAGGAYPSPAPHSDIVTTTTHKSLRGPRSGIIMGRAVHAKAVNKSVFPGLQGGPHMHTIASKAIAFELAMRPEFKVYAQQTVDNARALGEALIERGLKIVSGGTDSHLLLIDLRPAEISGKDAEIALGSIGVTMNKNTIPYDPQPPMVCSGIRCGTPALTTRGFGVSEMKEVADIITQALSNHGNTEKLAMLRESVRALSARFPLYKR
jgi:glycine hydroxymethyltransferase